MPSTSKKQHNFMEAVAHNPSFAKKVGVKQSVGKDFSTADKGKTFKQGGDMASKMNPGFMAMMKKKAGDKPAKKMATGGMTSMGKVKTGAPSIDGIAERGKTKGKNMGDSGRGMGMESGARGMKKGGKTC